MQDLHCYVCNGKITYYALGLNHKEMPTKQRNKLFDNRNTHTSSSNLEHDQSSHHNQLLYGMFNHLDSNNREKSTDRVLTVKKSLITNTATTKWLNQWFYFIFFFFFQEESILQQFTLPCVFSPVPWVNSLLASLPSELHFWTPKPQVATLTEDFPKPLHQKVRLYYIYTPGKIKLRKV